MLGFLTPGGRRTARWSRQLAGLLLVAVSLGWLISADAGSPITWVPFSEKALARATAAGRPALIDVGDDWCLPCREETPGLIAAYEQNRADGLVVLGINLQEANERARLLISRGAEFIRFRQKIAPAVISVLDRSAQRATGATRSLSTGGYPLSANHLGLIRRWIAERVR